MPLEITMVRIHLVGRVKVLIEVVVGPDVRLLLNHLNVTSHPVVLYVRSALGIRLGHTVFLEELGNLPDIDAEVVRQKLCHTSVTRKGVVGRGRDPTSDFSILMVTVETFGALASVDVDLCDDPVSLSPIQNA